MSMVSKARLTITLPQDLLSSVDQLVDGKSIRNRSHAIESLIRQGISPSVTTAVILAGSKSIKPSRLSPSLKKIDKQYLLTLQLKLLQKYGFTRIIICAGVYQHAIEEIFGDGSQLGVNIEYVEEKKPLGTAGVLKLATKNLKIAKGSSFLVMHGDILTDINLKDLVEFHLQENLMATIGVKPRISEKKYGQAFLHGNKIVRFLEKGASEGISIVNTGISVFKYEVLDMIAKNQKVKLESTVFPVLASRGQLGAFIFQGSWKEVAD